MSDEMDIAQDASATGGKAKGEGANKGPAVTRAMLDKRVQAATGAKISDVRNIVRATLEVMGTSLRAGERLNLPPFGLARPLKVANEKVGQTRVILRDIEEKLKPAQTEAPVAVKKGGKAKKRGLAAGGEAE